MPGPAGISGPIATSIRTASLRTAWRVFCRETGLDGAGGVAVHDGRIVASGATVSGDARKTVDYPDHLLLPGFVDMHTHVAPSDWESSGINPDTDILPRGTTTVLSQGDAGPVTWDRYRQQIIDSLRGQDSQIVGGSPDHQHHRGGSY